MPERFSTGIAALDQLLGGGLLPGTTTVVLGATGIGKTQLGLQFLGTGERQEGEAGIVFDMTSRGDSQSHQVYAERLLGRELRPFDAEAAGELETIWDRETSRRDIAHLFDRSGRRVTVRDLEDDEYKEWKADLNRKLHHAIRFFYGNFVHGVRRVVIDGIEPTEQASDSFQFNLFEYISHQILKKESEWVARDYFRVRYRANAEEVAQHAYDSDGLCGLLLATTHEVMLEDLLSRPIESGDVLSNANTIILMGKIRDGMTMGRALYVAKHRGSACEETIAPFRITETGLELL